MHDPRNAINAKVAPACLLLLLLGATPAAFANTYECSTFSIPGGNTGTTGINNDGFIVGTFTPTGSAARGYIRDAAGSVKMVDYPGASSTALYKINNNGVATGSAQISGAQINFTVDLNGNFQTITLPSPYDNRSFTIFGINDDGVLSGWESATQQPFTLTPTGTISLGIPSAFVISGSLNNSLQSLWVGYSGGFLNSYLSQPVLQTETQLIWNYPNVRGYPLPAGDADADGLNNAGAIVGFKSRFNVGLAPYVPFLRDPSGVFSEIVCPGIAYTTVLPFAINDNGVITGDNVTSPGNPGSGGAFIAAPLPGLSQFSATPSNLVFPPQQTRQSPAQSITITNTGNARMDIGALKFLGNPGFPTNFQLSGCVDPATGFASLPPGASCDVSVSFVLLGVLTPGVYSDHLIIDDNTPNSPHVIPVSVTVIGTQPPTCALSTTISGSHRQVVFTIQDAIVGLAFIRVSSATNATTDLPVFDPGVTTPVIASTTEVDPTQPSSVDLFVLNTATLSTDCVASLPAIGGGAGSSGQWSNLHGSIQGKVAVVADGAGNLEAFARGADKALLHTSQNATDLTWSAWENFGGVIISDPAAGLNADGTLEVFAVGGDSALWHRRQTSFGWSDWESLGGIILGNPAVAKNRAGLLELFVRGSDFAIWHDVPASGSGWISLNGVLLGDPIVATNEDGRLEVFARGGDQRLWQIAQSPSVSASWTGWTPLESGIFLGNPALVKNQAGLLELFVRSSDHSLHHNVQSSTDDLAWTGWTSLHGNFTSDPAAALDKDSRLEVFGRGGDNALWHAAQNTPASPLSDWVSLGGDLTESITANTDSGGRVEVFARVPDSSIWYLAQVLPGQWW